MEMGCTRDKNRIFCVGNGHYDRGRRTRNAEIFDFVRDFQKIAQESVDKMKKTDKIKIRLT